MVFTRKKVRRAAAGKVENPQLSFTGMLRKGGRQPRATPHVFSKRRLPTPSSVFPTYWKFATRRQELFFARVTGQISASSISDPILKNYRFTNVYRASDRVSQYLIKNVLYGGRWSISDTVFRLILFKFFNKVETWERLTDAVGSISWRDYDYNCLDRCLTELLADGTKIYSAAYIMPSGRTAFGHARKHRNHLKIIESAMRDGLPERVGGADGLRPLYELLRKYPCFGPFLAYQIAVDLNYTAFVNFSEDDFVQPGPGALDGISKTFTDFGDLTPSDIIRYMADIQEQAFGEFAPGFRTLWGRRLHLIDCQNIFCEVSKYARVAHPDVAGLSDRMRIKQRYRPTEVSLPRPWYPPKWGINQAIAQDASLNSSGR